jgi:phosphoglycolate phosphatase
MSQARYRHVIWDWNGTLLDDLDLCVDVMNDLLGRRSLLLLDRARYHHLFDFPVSAYYERLGFDFSRDSFEKLSAEFISAYDARRWECQLQRGARAVLESLQNGGVTQSVLSAYRQETLQEIVGHFGLTPRFLRILGLDNIYAPSKAELGRSWVAELAVPPGEILLIGDTLHDLAVAQAIGVDCVLVACGHHPEERLKSGTGCVIADLSGLSAWPGLVCNLL